ncbi:matrixin family metalloprotease [Thalassobaculum sp.]|uniref:matrixin family metalloprotease n=1 Tax=Thalassobaculum sp. TaxID=2022740 RepID=UPI0032EEE7C5
MNRLIVPLVVLGLALWVGGAAAGPQFNWLQLDSFRVKWGDPQGGTGTAVTYAFVAGAVHSAEARNCRDMQPLDGLLARSGIPAAVLEREAEAAFAMWQASADIRFSRIDDPAAAQILIGAQTQPRGVAFADVSYEPTGPGDVRAIRRSLVCLNPDMPWKVGFGGDISVYDLRYALAHEIGHAIGLDHPGPSGQLMSFRYDEQFRELQPGDIAGAVTLYGPIARTAATPPVLPAAAAADLIAPQADALCGSESRRTALTPRDSAC